MASLSLLLSVWLLSLFLPSALSLTCTSQKFTNKSYDNCTDLPQLGAYLHYTYNASNSSLSIAYVAAPATGGAWVAWAINPSGTGMVGSQALLALRLNSSVVPKTYNISGYHAVDESKLSFNVWDLSADEVNGTMRIFATVQVPEKVESVNQVWQVGGAINGDGPSIHPVDAANKESKGTLQLVSSTSPTAPAPSKNGARAGRGNGGLLASVILLMVTGAVL
ncbi:hypothetical protein BT93_K0955 [Corymbia citriodora subsp. variegata]|nr:hypothetical protein BT93_K0955 [Corymbia citriodora subsp. variegata]